MGPKMEISVGLVVPYNYKQSDFNWVNHYPLETLFINMVTLSFAAGSGGKGISISEEDSSLTTFNANWSA